MSDNKIWFQVGANAVNEKSVLANYFYFSENIKKKGWIKTWCVIPKDELCLYFYASEQVSISFFLGFQMIQYPVQTHFKLSFAVISLRLPMAYIGCVENSFTANNILRTPLNFKGLTKQ